MMELAGDKLLAGAAVFTARQPSPGLAECAQGSP